MILGKYKHFKGNVYEVVGVAKHSETLKDIVIYKNPEGELWVRDKEMFEETVIRDGISYKRFEFLK